jgi:hypothetical protein
MMPALNADQNVLIVGGIRDDQRAASKVITHDVPPLALR